MGNLDSSEDRLGIVNSLVVPKGFRPREDDVRFGAPEFDQVNDISDQLRAIRKVVDSLLDIDFSVGIKRPKYGYLAAPGVKGPRACLDSALEDEIISGTGCAIEDVITGESSKDHAYKDRIQQVAERVVAMLGDEFSRIGQQQLHKLVFGVRGIKTVIQFKFDASKFLGLPAGTYRKHNNSGAFLYMLERELEKRIRRFIFEHTCVADDDGISMDAFRWSYMEQQFLGDEDITAVNGLPSPSFEIKFCGPNYSSSEADAYTSERPHNVIIVNIKRGPRASDDIEITDGPNSTTKIDTTKISLRASSSVE